MKKIFNYLMPCLMAVLSLASCNDTMDDKADIDAKYEGKYNNPVVSVVSATSTNYQVVDVMATVDDETAVSELGVQLAADETFKNVKYAASDAIAKSFTASVDGLNEETTYYVRAYAIGKNGVTVYSQPQQVTTASAPTYSIEGTYTVEDYKNGDSGWSLFCNPYKVTIAFEEGTTDIVNITGLGLGSISRYGEGESTSITFQALYDAENNTISIPNNAIVANNPTYGNIWTLAYESDALVLHFNPKGGSMESDIVRYVCSMGGLGYFYHDMKHE